MSSIDDRAFVYLKPQDYFTSEKGELSCLAFSSNNRENITAEFSMSIYQKRKIVNKNVIAIKREYQL